MMAVSTMRHLRLSFVIVLIFACARTSRGTEAGVSPKVDPRVEWLSIVFRLAGNSEYNMSPLKTYTADIDAYFSPYKEHPAVALARKLAGERDVGFDAVMGLAVHLSPAPALKPLVAFTDDIPDARFGKDNAILFGGLFVLNSPELECPHRASPQLSSPTGELEG